MRTKLRRIEKRMKKPKWTFPKSLFAEYRQDTESVAHDAFVADWEHSSGAKMFKAAGTDNDPDGLVQADLEATKALLRSHYLRLIYSYKSYAAATTESFTVGLNSFSDFVNDIGVVEKGDSPCNLSNIDMIFIGANMTGSPST